ncbi:acyl-CoA thioester hydrolase [Dethiosulfatibacter aminovorans DSM 17477]|uniref:Acyl-CoA thioester hydrolase n=1 Tax=Dethiosulfatibacter aminovorans DSM 17477 TaxID=1121476 RepID=A0A1M6KZZ0_9FIRM|nr:thioesterase family protein [Dethiosulfatibacter aminovorans]SHJ64541.1 acyl-CoA thioester hydrolase [Dethiosulfatibacter aminovorans DSM 17477]
MKNMNKNELTYKSFPLQSYDKVRFADTDKLGHVNNALFFTFLETGQSEMGEFECLVEENNCGLVLASVKLDLLNEIKYPGTVEIGTGVTRIGNSSLTVYQGLFQNGENVALAESVVVQMDNATRKSKPLSDEMKEVLKKYLVE